MDKIYRGCDKINEYEKVNNIKELIENSEKKYSEEIAFKFKTDKDGIFKTKTYKEYVADVKALGTALISVGLKDKRIAIISENRYEWTLAYLATVTGVGIVVPLDRALPITEILTCLERSNAEAIIFSEKYSNIMSQIKETKKTDVKFFISMDQKDSNEKMYSLKELIEIGKSLIKNGARTYLDATIDNDGMAIMLFTSGTTSTSKIVMLSHNNICNNIADIGSVLYIDEKDTILSFLPLHHTFENTAGFLYPISVGAKIAYCEGIRHIADNIREYQVSIMISVPALFENMYKTILKKIEKQGKMSKFKTGIKVSNFLRKVGIDKRRQLFKDIHEVLGGKLRLFVAGAAAFEPELAKGINDLGIETYQGYGLTESSPVIAAENKKYHRIGSVGNILPSWEGKIVDKNESGIGEIVVKGPSVMLGYYENEEATKETIKDGWLYTGDLGYFDKDGYLFITGRKKSVIVLKNGKNIYPEEIENLINRIEGVKESFVFGKPENDNENDLKITAKIVYDQEFFKGKSEEDIKEIIWEQIKENVNKAMPTYKYIKEIIVTDKELIKTTTLKIKRHEEIKTIK